MTITSGVYFPPKNYQAARATSLVADGSGSIAFAAMDYSSGTTSNQILAFNPSTSGWTDEAEGPQTFYQPVGVIPGYTLDSQAGLWAWGAGFLVSGDAPYVGVVSGGASGFYVANLANLWTSGNTQISGVSVSGIIDLIPNISTPANPWLLASSKAWSTSISGTSGTTTQTTLPFTATCAVSSGSGLVVGGYQDLNLSASGSHALAVGVSGTALVSFPGSGSAQTWTLSGSPVAVWTPLATTTGLPAYSSGISAAWTPLGNQVILSDYGNQNWYVFTYTGGSLSLLTSGMTSGLSQGIAVDSSSTYAAIPRSGGSGITILQASGATWINSGVQVSGSLHGVGAVIPQALGGYFAFGSSGLAGQLIYSGGSWATGNAISIPTNPTVGYFDSAEILSYWADSTGSLSVTQWTSQQSILSGSGTWAASSGIPLGLLAYRGQVIVPTSGAYHTAYLSPVTGIPTNGTLVAAGNGFASNISLPVATSGSLGFQHYGSPFEIYAINQGCSGLIASGGASVTASGVLGQGCIPSALGYGVSGGLVLATHEGGLGYLASGFGGLSYLLASGGFSDMVVASGQLFLSTTVQGSLVVVGGL